MFFTTELLEKRDGGFGLLWLAATLGSKSTLKKLPRRDVLTADISQLCDLIMQPAEPLALRLTSNLMVGVARVYKVKQDMFMTDVTTCFNSLKKIVHELHTATDMQLQMAQPTLKSSLLTLDAVKELAGFDFFVADWDDYLNLRDEDDAPEEDEDFNPSGKKLKLKSKPPASTEYPRTDKHTLQEHHEDFLSKSLDLSFNGSFVGGHIPSSSQIGGPFNIPTDDFFQSDGLDIGAVGDELARELGEGWGASPAKDGFGMRLDLQNDIPFFETGGDFDLGFGDDPFLDGTAALQPLEQGQAASKKRKAPPGCQDDMPPPPTPGREPSPSTSFSRMLLSQDEQQPGPLSDITALNRNQENIPNKMKKPKKTRLLLDARTELTDEELKTARAEYLRGQYALKQELELKKAEKDGMKLVEDTLWGAPHGIQAPSLIDFWQENFKVQVEARTGALHIHPPDVQSPKRRKIRHAPKEPHHFDVGMPDFHQDLDAMQFDFEAPMEPLDAGRLRSSEEPGQGRNASRAPSVLGDNFGFDFGVGLDGQRGNSQRSSLFPWDNAGASSSVAGFAPFNGSDRVSVDHAEMRLRGSSLSRREDSLIPSQVGAFSPAILGKNSQLVGEDYAFDVPMDIDVVNQSGVDESQMSDMNLITLEKNSFNFLEYTRMQYQTLPATTRELTFDRIVPTTSSTRHVAATAFYHCLVLSTKKLLRVKQNDPYGTITIAIA
ncbi:hypothetical protein PLEOSDRAFT_1111526 [Pleurotus ostreatus PC15]|uniref:Rad21/Rec8-like protein N-terminal domain-containing protein n=1 Tax=Pleurotus ostreatus (strain PC15) TaxID=1137138 RepID=A0A067NSD2_PLEO1|nr:hypothetical protein PLEOSDRAFT_1111526 [Pleurotus ostreatus PC15]